MSEPVPLHTDLDRLLAKLVDHFLSDDERSRLETVLAESATARRHYFHYLDLHAELLARLDQSDIVSPPALRPVAPSPTHPLAPSSKTPVLGFLGHVSRRVPGGEFTVGSLLVLVIVAAFWGLSQAILHPKLGGHDLAHDPAPLAPDKGRGAGGEGELVAIITDTADAWGLAHFPQSAKENVPVPFTPGQQIAPGQPLSIAAGLVELELKQGTKLVIEGPAEWSIDGNNIHTLKQGKLVARVPKQAIGFTLHTPAAKIVDLSTEFGVEVGIGGTAEVQVMKGLVDVHPREANARLTKPVRLKAGEGVRISVDGKHFPGDPEVGRKFAQLAEGKPSFATRKRSTATRLIDLSKGAIASQSSERGFPASNAIDRNPDTFSHTSHSGDRAPWWQVDLGKPQAIASVVVVNRLVTGKSRLRNITIKLLASDGVTEVATSPLLNPGNKEWGGVRDDSVGPTQLSHDFRSRAGEPATGRFVRIERASHPEDQADSDHGNPVLTIGEVQVFDSGERD